MRAGTGAGLLLCERGQGEAAQPGLGLTRRRHGGRSQGEVPHLDRERTGALGPYSQTIVTNGFVFCSGTVGFDRQTGSLPMEWLS